LFVYNSLENGFFAKKVSTSRAEPIDQIETEALQEVTVAKAKGMGAYIFYEKEERNL